MKIALVHYAYTPVVGGVEFVLEQHAALFARHGHAVRVVCGVGETDRRDIEVVVVPELLPSSEAALAAQEALREAGGERRPAFAALRERLRGRFREAVEGCDLVFVHNLMTMHFNLAATAALADLAGESGGVRFVSWVHDLAAINPDYELPDPTPWPWCLIRRPPAGFESVCISPERQRQFAGLMDVPPEACPVIPNGVEYLRLLRLTAPVQGLVRQFGLLYRDVVLLHPTRILRRKNIEFGVRVLAELEALGAKSVYLVTGAPDPHHAESVRYGAALRRLVAELGVERSFLFLSERFAVRDEDLAALYQVSDAVFLPSRQEGFGLPILEAGLFRIPVFCAGIEPMRSILTHNVTTFDLAADPGAVAVDLLEALGASRGFLARKEVLRNYSWDRLFERIIEPMFMTPSRPSTTTHD